MLTLAFRRWAADKPAEIMLNARSKSELDAQSHPQFKAHRFGCRRVEETMGTEIKDSMERFLKQFH
jgi:hypothetical protein